VGIYRACALTAPPAKVKALSLAVGARKKTKKRRLPMIGRPRLIVIRDRPTLGLCLIDKESINSLSLNTKRVAFAHQGKRWLAWCASKDCYFEKSGSSIYFVLICPDKNLSFRSMTRI